MYVLFILLVSLTASWSFPSSSRRENAATCGYEACNPIVPGMLNVHIVPHSHDDVGWLKTVDQYYYGERSNIQRAGVQYIIDSVLNELLKDPNKRYIQVETAFFWKWWLEQDDETREQYKSLISSGQIEMTGGGWSMHDEAAVHYHSAIDQMTLGLRRIYDLFGDCGRPRAGWQIDPFGHARESASLMAQMGFDGLMFARLDYQDKDTRRDTSTMEMVWRASANLGSSADLFTSVLYDFYGAPAGYCFDINCGDDPIIDNKKSIDYNADQKVDNFLNYIDDQSKHFTTKNILIPMGGDFNFQDAHMYYKSLDKLIKHANERQQNGSNVNLLYSTVACYIKAVNDEGQIFSTKDDDFFPYSSDPHSFWTGYFTSRPALKRFERLGNNFLQIAKQLSTFAKLTDEDSVAKVDSLREAMGIMQHHDAITGTEKQAVADDYARILDAGIEDAEVVVKTAINALVADTTSTESSLDLTHCHLLNISQCDVSESSADFLVTIYNPVSHPVSQYIRLPVTGQSYKVLDPSGNEIVSQLVPVSDGIVRIPERTSKATSELVFLAENLPALGFTSYQISSSSSAEKMTVSEESDDNTIGNDMLAVEIDPTTGLIKSVTHMGEQIALEQNFYYYNGALGDNSDSTKRSSGAYIFRPDGTDAIVIGDSVTTKVYKGDLVEEVHQIFSDWASQVIRVYKNEMHVELQWTVGPIPIDDAVGKEPISRFTTDLDTQEIFYTDSMGREMLQRKRNYRPTWEVSLEEPVAGNYYPLTSKILIKDETRGVEVAVLNDRAQGGSSLKDGQIEVMVHRRLLHDDAFGAGEALNESQYQHGLIATGKLYLVAGKSQGDMTQTLAAHQRLLAQQVLLAPWIFLSPNDGNNNAAQFTGIKTELPVNVHVLTLEPLSDTTILLRLEHLLEKDEDPELSKDVTVNLQDLLTGITISSCQEMTLGANQLLSDSHRLEWKTTETRKHTKAVQVIQDDFEVTLSPMQIRTFILTTE